MKKRLTILGVFVMVGLLTSAGTSMAGQEFLQASIRWYFSHPVTLISCAQHSMRSRVMCALFCCFPLHDRRACGGLRS
jgi:hypothetical protein